MVLKIWKPIVYIISPYGEILDYRKSLHLSFPIIEFVEIWKIIMMVFQLANIIWKICNITLRSPYHENLQYIYILLSSFWNLIDTFKILYRSISHNKVMG